MDGGGRIASGTSNREQRRDEYMDIFGRKCLDDYRDIGGSECREHILELIFQQLPSEIGRTRSDKSVILPLLHVPIGPCQCHPALDTSAGFVR